MSRADTIRFVSDWLAGGAIGSQSTCDAMAEMVAGLGDPPDVPADEEQWPRAVAKLIALEEAAPVEPGGVTARKPGTGAKERRAKRL